VVGSKEDSSLLEWGVLEPRTEAKAAKSAGKAENDREREGGRVGAV